MPPLLLLPPLPGPLQPPGPATPTLAPAPVPAPHGLNTAPAPASSHTNRGGRRGVISGQLPCPGAATHRGSGVVRRHGKDVRDSQEPRDIAYPRQHR